MICFHWNSTNLNPSNSNCGFYVTSICAASVKPFFTSIFVDTGSLVCESLIKGKILMSFVDEFSPREHNFGELSVELKIIKISLFF